MKKHLFIFAVAFVLFFSLGADVSPWDAWRLGYTCYEQGEGCRDRGEYTKALKAFQEALNHYNSVRRARPDWNQKVIARRIADCERECERMKRLLGDSEPDQETMAETGAAALRPASKEVAKEMDDIRKQLSEARAELAALKQSTSAQRNYEQEITQLLRDQRVARERYQLLERRYRDLDRASRQPDRETQEVKEQLLEEKMHTEQLKKQIAALERRRKSEDERFRVTETRRRSVEKQLSEKISEIARLTREGSSLRSDLEKQRKLAEQVETFRKRFASAVAEKEAVDRELTETKAKLASVLDKTTGGGVPMADVRVLQEQLKKMDAEKTQLQQKLDKTLSDVENLRVQLVRLRVLESARQDLERHLAEKNKSLEQANKVLAVEKKTVEELRRKMASLIGSYEKNTAIDKLHLKNQQEEIANLKKELETLKQKTPQSRDNRIAELEKEIEKIQALERRAVEKATRLESDFNHLKKISASQDAEIKRIRQTAAGGAAAAELQKKLAEAEKRLLESNKALETHLASFDKKRKEDAAQLLEYKKKISALQQTIEQKKAAQNAVSDAVLAEENKKLHEELRQVKHLMQKKEGDLTRLGVELESIKKQNDDFGVSIGKTKENNEKLAGEIVSLKAELEREKRSSGAIASELQRTRDLKIEVEQDLKTALDRAARLEKRMSNRDSEDFRRLTASRDERKKLADQIAALQEETVRIKAEADSLRKGNENLKGEVQRLLKESTGVTAERDRLLADRKKHLAAIGKLAGMEKNFDQLKKDFAALQNENKENKLLVEAAKPREAELAQIKLRLTELDQLKAQLTKEQRFNEELKMANRRLEKERGNAIILRSQLTTARKRIGELEPLIQEISALKKLNAELAEAKKFEAELVAARSRLNSFESVRLELDHAKQRVKKLELEKLELERSAARARNLASGTQLLNTELESARKTADELAKDKALREMELARLRARLGEIPRLEAEIKRLRSIETGNPEAAIELQRLRRQSQNAGVVAESFDKLENEMSALKKLLESIRKENSTLRLRAAEAVRMREVIERLTQVNKALEKNLPVSGKELAELKKRNALLEADSQALKKMQQQSETLQQLADAREKELIQLRTETIQMKALRTENTLLRKQNQELEQLDEVKRQLLSSRQETAKLKGRAEAAEKLQKQLLRAETSAAEKQAALDRSQRQLAAAGQLKKDLMAQKQESSAMQLELSRVRTELEKVKLQLVQTDTLRRELERQKKLTAELASAKGIESELAQAKLRLAEFEQIKKELARVTKYNNELTEIREKLEKELASRSSSEDRLRYQLDMISTVPTGNPDDFVASGKIAEADGSFELAIWNYEQALKINRNHVQASLRLGLLMLERRNFNRAVTLLSSARAADPVNVSLACHMADAYIGLKRYGNALAVLTPLAERNGDDHRVQLLLGKAYAGSGNLRRAEAHLNIAVRRAPKNVFAPRLELAKFLVTTDVRRLEEAARIYEAARVAGAAPDIELEPKLGSRLDERREVSGFLATAAREAEKNGDWKTAGWYYKQLVELGRNKENYLVRFAFAQYKNGDAPLALETLAFNRTTALGMLLTAFIQLAGKEYPAMLASARKAVALNGGKPVLIPADWSGLAIEFERLKRLHPAEMTDAVKRSFRISL